MSRLTPEEFSDQHRRDLQHLRLGGRGRLAKPLLFVVLSAVLIFAVANLLDRYRESSGGFATARRDARQVGGPWVADFSKLQADYRGWLLRHGTSREAELFDTMSTLLLRNTLRLPSLQRGSGKLGLFSRLYLSFHLGAVRVSFLVAATWRLWVAAVIIAVLYPLIRQRVYQGDDILGQTGNGRLFYTGIRADLRDLTSQRAPGYQVVGLGCPELASPAKVKTSELGRLLEQLKVANETNQSLAAVILARPSWPTYVAQATQREVLDDLFNGSTLGESTPRVLTTVFGVHDFLVEAANGAPGDLEALLLDNSEIDHPAGKIALSDHMIALERALYRVLTPDLARALTEVTRSELASTVLAYEAGKTLAFAFEAGKWVHRSNYPQLSARAVLHSIPAYSREYDFDSRRTIRQSLIYAARRSAFGPVRFPTTLDDKTRALRQWVEILSAAPHEIRKVADSVELYQMMFECNKNWSNAFLRAVEQDDVDLLNTSYVSPTNLVLVPLLQILRFMHETMDRRDLARLATLAERVGRAAVTTKAVTTPENGNEEIVETVGPNPLVEERVLPPIPFEEQVRLAKTHELERAAVADWSALRIALSSFGWLARRVGDYGVPESFLIFAALEAPEGTAGRNEFGYVGRPGMVALRPSSFEDRFGRAYRSRFIEVDGANMAESKGDYLRLMRGEELELPEALEGVTSTG